MRLLLALLSLHFCAFGCAARGSDIPERLMAVRSTVVELDTILASDQSPQATALARATIASIAADLKTIITDLEQPSPDYAAWVDIALRLAAIASSFSK